VGSMYTFLFHVFIPLVCSLSVCRLKTAAVDVQLCQEPYLSQHEMGRVITHTDRQQQHTAGGQNVCLVTATVVFHLHFVS